MFSRVRKHFSYANIALAIALVFAMTGGAYAAGKYVITSTKQIKPSVLSQLRGKAGALGAAGSQGPAGPAGAKGDAGASGANGTNGTNGVSVETSTFSGVKNGCLTGGTEVKSASPTVSVCDGKEGKAGPEGSPWTAGGILPPEKSEKGTWATIYTASAAEQPGTSAISFTIPLGTAPEAHYIKAGETPPAGCSDTNEKPEAEPGNLCVFAEGFEGNAKEYKFHKLFGTYFIGTSALGTVVTTAAVEPGEVFAAGSWVVTAPKAG